MLINEKQNGKSAPNCKNRISLKERPLELVYFIFFIVHLIATLCLDILPFYPPALVPTFMSNFHKWYLADTRDPLVSSFLGLYGEELKASVSWFESFFYCEVFIQTPIFILALYALWHNHRAYYVILAVYGAHASTTILPCLLHFIRTPACAADDSGLVQQCINSKQRFTLLSSYGVFFILTVVLVLDMSYRCLKWVDRGLRAEEEQKWE